MFLRTLQTSLNRHLLQIWITYSANMVTNLVEIRHSRLLLPGCCACHSMHRGATADRRLQREFHPQTKSCNEITEYHRILKIIRIG